MYYTVLTQLVLLQPVLSVIH